MGGLGTVLGNLQGTQAVEAQLKQMIAQKYLQDQAQQKAAQQQFENTMRGKDFSLREREVGSREEQNRLTLEARAAEQKAIEERAMRDDVRAELEQLPMDTEIPAERFQGSPLAKYAATSFKEEAPYQPEGPTQEGGILPAQPQRFRFLGTAAQQAKKDAAREKDEAQAESTRQFNERLSEDKRYHTGMLNKPSGMTLEDFEAREQIKAKYGGSKPSIGTERNALAFLNRAKDADTTLTESGLENRIAQQGLAGQVQGAIAPNMFQTKEQQLYRQAQRSFTEARLRKESGAAVPQSEYDNDARTYFAQPGDSPEVIAQKQQKRQVVLDGLAVASGKAYEEYYGEPYKPRGAGAKPAAPAAGPKTLDDLMKLFPGAKITKVGG